MAVKLMTLREIDRQFLEDNMLTEEDFQYGDNFESTLEDDGFLLKYMENDSELLTNGVFTNPVSLHNNNDNVFDESFMRFLNDSKSGHEEIKSEPLSPYSSHSSPSPETLWSCNGDIPVLSIPDSVGGECAAEVIIPDTPPHTPPDLTDCNSTSSICVSSAISPAAFVTSVGPDLMLPNVPTMSQNTTPLSIETVSKPVMNGSYVNGVANSKPFVLTPEQFAMLTNGKLKIKSVTEVKPVASRSQASVLLKTVKQKLPPVVTKEVGVKSRVIDLTALKRQQRIIKNRESAFLSRKKKKEYVQKLEGEVKEISAQNGKLKFENSELRRKIVDLEKENENLKSLNRVLKMNASTKVLKKTTGLMVVLFIFTFNLGPLARLFEQNVPTEIPKVSAPHRVGRSLLWEDPVALKVTENRSSPYVKMKTAQDEFSGSYADEWESSVNITFCPTFINRTESQRLDNDLRGWVHRVGKKRKMMESVMGSSNSRVEQKYTPLPLPKMQSWLRKKNEHHRHTWNHGFGNNEVMIYHSPRKMYEDFFDAIHRRDDTFYFVSFSGDHLLLPATTHNQTLRPRMSLVMPAMTFNESMGKLDEHVSMMQIDCEVMNTKLVYVKESAIPAHLRQKENATKAHIHKKFMKSPAHKDISLQKSKFGRRTYS